MATSTIFANVKLTDRKQAEEFIDAMVKSSQDPKYQPSGPAGEYLTDKAAIRALMAKREKKQG